MKEILFSFIPFVPTSLSICLVCWAPFCWQVVARLTPRNDARRTNTAFKRTPRKRKRKTNFILSPAWVEKWSPLQLQPLTFSILFRRLSSQTSSQNFHPELGGGMDWQRMSGEGEQREPLAEDCLKRGWLIHIYISRLRRTE